MGNMDEHGRRGRHGGFDSPEVGCYEVEGADTRGGALGFRPRGRGRTHAKARVLPAHVSAPFRPEVALSFHSARST